MVTTQRTADMKVRITQQPRGYLSLDGDPLTKWPPAGEVVDLPDGVAEDLIKGGNAEKVIIGERANWLWPWQRPQPKPPADVKVRIKVRPVGYISLDGGPLTAYPPVGATLDVPPVVAEDLIAGGFAEAATDDEPTVKTVRLKVKRAWPRAGTMLDVPESLAKDLLAVGLADLVPAAQRPTPTGS